jgi:hypothetical protein
MEGDGLCALEQSSSTRTRWMAHRHISQDMVVRVLHDHLFYPFPVQHVQVLRQPLVMSVEHSANGSSNAI